jgi:hypothetical protein
LEVRSERWEAGSKKREFRSGESGGRQGFKERVMGVTGYKIDEA